MKPSRRTLVFVGIPAILASIALASCEDDPILAPQTGTKPTNGSYGNIAIAPRLDSTASQLDRPGDHLNPEVY